ncbi:MAG TPA: RHS repeat-associated core domain-containing protein, partial [Pyrinomonadaceae bacterium]|nr:RHS repeat-associated core domain-containing protein [Pyrinomonadaceae bacterium]
RGASATYAYSPRHLPTSITYGVPSGVAPTANVTFEYDAAGSRTRMNDGQGHVTYAYDSLSRLTSESRHLSALGQSYPLTYTYDLAGQLTSYTDHRGSKVTYGYDSVGRVASVTGSGPSGAASYAPDLRYRAFGALKSISYGNGRSLSVAYDSRLRVRRWDVASVMGFEYSYASDTHQEKTGRVVYARSLYDATLDRSYEYDHVGRLVVSHSGAEARAHVGIPAGSQWGTLDGPYSHGYEYDARGNLLRRHGWGGLLGGAPGSSNQQVKAYDANNRQTDFQYDAAGNVTNEIAQTFTYDATGQQATALTYFGLAVNQWYDGDRLRVKKQDGGATTFYVRSSVLGGQVVAELNAAGGWQRGYVYGGGGELLAIRANDGVKWAHQDPATKSQRLTDTTGAVVAVVDLDPWGGETGRSSNSALQPRKFTTYERDSNADDEAMMRRYSRRHGRFSQPDPFDGSYDLTDPQSFNRYAYVRNDPVNFIDPSGLDPIVLIDGVNPEGIGGFRYGPGGVNGGYRGTGGIVVFIDAYGSESGNVDYWSYVPINWDGGRRGRRRRGGRRPAVTPPQQAEEREAQKLSDCVEKHRADYEKQRSEIEEAYKNAPGRYSPDGEDVQNALIVWYFTKNPKAAMAAFVVSYTNKGLGPKADAVSARNGALRKAADEASGFIRGCYQRYGGGLIPDESGLPRGPLFP